MKIAIVTVGRSDWSIYLPIIEAMKCDPRFEPLIIAGGAHWSRRHGYTGAAIEKDFPIAEKVRTNAASDSGASISRAIAQGVQGFTRAFVSLAPDWILLLGDRYEMLAAAVAAAPLQLPVAHLHGGEATFGALDDSFRHAITKLSHLHFVSASAYARRVRQLGEEPWRVIVSGAPALELAGRQSRRFSLRQISREFPRSFRSAPMLVTYHPETLSRRSVQSDFSQLLSALDAVDAPIIFTAPNADEGGEVIRKMIHQFLAGKANASFIENLGERYYSVLRNCSVVVGNSSSGILEAATFGIPVVNVGDRQLGRVRGSNVLDVPPRRAAIAAAIDQAISPAFRKRIHKIANPYTSAKGSPSRLILRGLLKFRDRPALLRKEFCDLK